MPQQRKVIVKTGGSQNKEESVVITIKDEEAEKLDALDRWVAEEKKARRKIDDVRFEPVEPSV